MMTRSTRPPSPTAATGHVLKRILKSVLFYSLSNTSGLWGTSTSSIPISAFSGLHSEFRLAPPSAGWHKGLLLASTDGMRVRQAEPAFVKPGEPDGYGTWTAERLEGWLRQSSGRDPVIVLADRAPGSLDPDAGGHTAAWPAMSSLETAVEPLIRACSGVWIARGAERRGAEGEEEGEARSKQPPFRVRRIDLQDSEERDYYYAFANEALWPMCHRSHVKP